MFQTTDSINFVNKNLTSFLQNNKVVYTPKEKMKACIIAEFCLDQLLTIILGCQKSNQTEDHKQSLLQQNVIQNSREEEDQIALRNQKKEIQKETNFTQSERNFEGLKNKEDNFIKSDMVKSSSSQKTLNCFATGYQLLHNLKQCKSQSQIYTNKNIFSNSRSPVRKQKSSHTTSKQSLLQSPTLSVIAEKKMTEQFMINSDRQSKKSEFQNVIENSGQRNTLRNLTEVQTIISATALNQDTPKSEKQLAIKNYELKNEVKSLKNKMSKLKEDNHQQVVYNQKIEQIFLDILEIAIESDFKQTEVDKIILRYEQLKNPQGEQNSLQEFRENCNQKRDTTKQKSYNVSQEQSDIYLASQYVNSIFENFGNNEDNDQDIKQQKDNKENITNNFDNQNNKNSIANINKLNIENNLKNETFNFNDSNNYNSQINLNTQIIPFDQYNVDNLKKNSYDTDNKTKNDQMEPINVYNLIKNIDDSNNIDNSNNINNLKNSNNLSDTSNSVNANMVSSYINQIYGQINFQNSTPLKYDDRSNSLRQDLNEGILKSKQLEGQSNYMKKEMKKNSILSNSSQKQQQSEQYSQNLQISLSHPKQNHQEKTLNSSLKSNIFNTRGDLEGSSNFNNKNSIQISPFKMKDTEVINDQLPIIQSISLSQQRLQKNQDTQQLSDNSDNIIIEFINQDQNFLKKSTIKQAQPQYQIIEQKINRGFEQGLNENTSSINSTYKVNQQQQMQHLQNLYQRQKERENQPPIMSITSIRTYDPEFENQNLNSHQQKGNLNIPSQSNFSDKECSTIRTFDPETMPLPNQHQHHQNNYNSPFNDQNILQSDRQLHIGEYDNTMLMNQRQQYINNNNDRQQVQFSQNQRSNQQIIQSNNQMNYKNKQIQNFNENKSSMQGVDASQQERYDQKSISFRESPQSSFYDENVELSESESFKNYKQTQESSLINSQKKNI